MKSTLNRHPHSWTRPAFTFAFQPIVDVVTRTAASYEALVRGPKNESALSVFAGVPPIQRFAFDRDLRAKAIALASQLNVPCDLNLNFLPQSLKSAEISIRATIDAAIAQNFPISRIMLEVTEGEAIYDLAQFAEFTNQYRSLGLRMAIDDFGAGYSGLNLLADFQPDQLKLDKNLLRGIECRGARQAIVRAIAQVCRDLAIDLIAEGVETRDEFHWLLDEGITLFQGYLLARPGFESLPEIHLPSLTAPHLEILPEPAFSPLPA